MKLDRKIDPLHGKLSLDSNKEIPEPIMGRTTIYPIRHMQQGESFFVPCKDDNAFSRVRSSVYSAARRHRIKITVRRLEEDGVDGLRVWRVE